MIHVSALLFFTFAGAAANALSCTPPNLAKNFNWYQESDKSYQLFVGKVEMKDPTPKYIEGRVRHAKGIAHGRFIEERTLTQVLSFDITVKSICAGSWCGEFPSENQNSDWVIFLEKTSKGDLLTIGPCHQTHGQYITKDQINVLQKCLRQGKCSDGDIKLLQMQ